MLVLQTVVHAVQGPACCQLPNCCEMHSESASDLSRQQAENATANETISGNQVRVGGHGIVVDGDM
jgi:hypothetical protein